MKHDASNQIQKHICDEAKRILEMESIKKEAELRTIKAVFDFASEGLEFVVKWTLVCFAVGISAMIFIMVKP